jgi:hypothetical protein
MFIFLIWTKIWGKKYVPKFGHVRKFEMKHINNKVLQIYLQHKTVESWLKTW